MKKNGNNIDKLLTSEKEFRDQGNSQKCLDICLKILEEIKLLSHNKKFDIISKLFLYDNQSNYVRIHVMHELFQNNNFIDSKSLKRKYYKLLIDSFKNGNSTDLLKEKNEIIKLYDNCELNNFEEIDKYIVDFVFNFSAMNNEINYKIHNNLPVRKTKTFDNDFIQPTPTTIESSEKRLDQDSITPNSNMQTSFEEINSHRQTDFNFSVQKIIPQGETERNKIKQLMKKYKPDSNLPLVIISVSANLNKNQFLELIKNIFVKLKYRILCCIKDNEYENLNIFEYHSKNCCENLKYLCKKKFPRNQFQVLTILKSNENNFSTGINTFLNDINERKLSIKAIKGNEQSIIIFLVNFLQKFGESMNKIKIIKQSKCLLKYNIEENLKNIINNRKKEIYTKAKIPNEILYSSKNSKYKDLIDDETYVEKTNYQATKYYELYRILSKNDYELGKSLKNFIDNFKKKYQSLTFSQIINLDTKLIMIDIVKMLELCINTLNSTYNNYQNNDSAYFSLASEQFLFSKIYYIIYDIYDKKYKKQNNDFLLTQKEINENLSIKEIIKKIGIKEKFRSKEEFPYKSVIDILGMISFERSLRKKFEILTSASLEIRTCVLEYSNGKYELDSMDDELPIIIYIATQIKVTNIFAELNIVDDYFKIISRDDLIQNKMITNLLSSLMFITKMWNSEKKDFNDNNFDK